MEAFFQKYPVKFSESSAVKMIHEKVHCAKDAFKEKKREEGLKYLAEAYRMIEDFMTEINQDPYAL